MKTSNPWDLDAVTSHLNLKVEEKNKFSETITDKDTKHFLLNYPLKNKFHPPKQILLRVKILVLTTIFVILDVVMVAFFLLTYAIRRWLQIVGLCTERQYPPTKINTRQNFTNSKAPQVCIIGCGLSGLTATKLCQENNLSVTAYDKHDSIGGVFATAYEDGYFTTSNFFSAFADFPCQIKDLPVRSWSFTDYQQYLQSYVDHFNLSPHLRFHHSVDSVEQMEDDRWKVSVKNLKTGTVTFKMFDNVIVCSGVNQQSPETPEYLQNAAFHGQVIHSSAYKSARDFVGKRVLLIGLGESASDISYNIAAVARHVCIVARSGPGVVLERYHGGIANDIGTTRAYHSLPRSLFAHRPNVVSAWWRFKLWLKSSYNIEEDDALQEAQSKVNYSRYHWMRRFGTKSTSFIWTIRQFGAKYKEVSITGLDEDGAIFDDGDRYDCDVIIICSGYQQAFPFLPQDLKKLNYRNDLWKKVIHPRYGETISFVGFARPAVGAIPPISEMQARFVALLIAKRIELPTVSNMMDTIKKDRDYEEWLFPFDYKRIDSLCSYLETMTDWSRLTGRDIPMWNLMLQDPKLFHRVMLGPILPCQYNLFRIDKATDYKEVRSSLFITAIIPVDAQLYQLFLLIGAAAISNLGLCEPPIGFSLK